MTHKIEFTDAVTKELEKRLSCERDAKIYRRLQYLDLKRRGYNSQQIGEILDVSPAQLTNWSRLFVKEGFEGLCHLKYEGRRLSRLDPHRERIKAYIEQSHVPTLASLQQWIKVELHLDIEQSWLGRWLKKNLRAPTRRHA
jgi:transposase